jgi:UDP-glucose 4-epimerase
VGTSINTLLETLGDIAGQELTPRHGPRRPGDIRHSYLDCGKIERDLGWRAEVSLGAGLARTYRSLSAGSQAPSVQSRL